jgi:hypothetical protein
VEAKLPFNAMSRAAVDAETARVRHCVIPIISEKKRRPTLEGSAVAVAFRGRKFLVTAEHVMNESGRRPLMYFAADTHTRPLGGAFTVSKTHDIAVLQLADHDIEDLSHIPFLDENAIGSAADQYGRYYASVTGYPHKASKLKDPVTLDTGMEVLSSLAIEGKDGVIAVSFDKKEGGWTTDGHSYARDPTGKSGGAIFGMPLLGLNAVRPFASIKLTGIGTFWDRKNKRILGASSSVLIPLLTAAIENSTA